MESAIKLPRLDSACRTVCSRALSLAREMKSGRWVRFWSAGPLTVSTIYLEDVLGGFELSKEGMTLDARDLGY